MKNCGIEWEARNREIGHRKRLWILFPWGPAQPLKHKNSRIKKHGRIRRVKPPWKSWMPV